MDLFLSCILILISILCICFLIIKMNKTEAKAAYISGIIGLSVIIAALICYVTLTILFLNNIK